MKKAIKHLLYLEDDEALAFVTQRALTKEGLELSHAADIESLRRLMLSCPFDAALLDLKIGNKSALMLIEEIKAQRDVPIVVLSGYGTIRTAVKAVKLGAVDFLSKPSSIEQILAALQMQQADDDLDLEQKPSLKAQEWEAIQKALDENEGNISAAARQLKMHRRTLQRKLSKRHLD